jgi:hypothetical protein
MVPARERAHSLAGPCVKGMPVLQPAVCKQIVARDGVNGCKRPTPSSRQALPKLAKPATRKILVRRQRRVLLAIVVLFKCCCRVEGLGLVSAP